jgi:thiol:disulfide interchange protein/DsbC/DsbD-like thiol-disulfide interchange protein
MLSRFLFLLLLAALPLAPASRTHAQSNAFTQATNPEPNCVASLLADTAAIAPGKPFTVGVRFKLAKGWHLYWQFPGESGAAPSVAWQLPPGFQAGPIQWPLPHALVTSGVIFTNVYENELVLPVEIRPPAELPPGKVALTARIKWFVCSDTCLPGNATLTLELPSGPVTPDNQELFATWKAKLPQDPPAPFTVEWTRAPKELQIRVQGIPDKETLEIFPIPPAGLTPDHPESTPSATPGTAQFKIPIADPDPAGAQWRALFVLTAPDGTRRGWELANADAAASNPGVQPNGSAPATFPPAAKTPSNAPQEIAPAAPSKTNSLAGVLWGAFLGGLLLNLMPCVLPVIALKIFGFTQQAGQDPRRVFKLGLAFASGVFTFFLGLALAVIGLKAAGGGLNWGFQFQNPWILLGLISAVFIFGLNLLGVFEITLSSTANSRLSELSGQHGYGGAFLHGMFTTLLGTSCTAPYLGVTLGFAVSQPAPSVILIFLTIAAGMSLPYLILTANTSLLRFLPKPGLWMERLKQGMGFIMLGVAIWLLTVLGQSRGAAVLGGTCAYLLSLGIGCWLLGVLQSRIVALLVAVALAFAGYRLFVHEPLNAPLKLSPAAESGDWVAFSPERVAAERAAGHAVFVDFTADWCLNCKVNERLTLSKPEVMEAFKRAGVVLVKADWTNGDKTITEELNRFGRVGVPFYLLYPPKSGEPVIFPELLTPTMILEAVQKLSSGVPPSR